MGSGVRGDEVKLWGCSTGVLFIPGRSLAAELGWVVLQRAEFSLADHVGGAARPAWWDVEFLLAERATFLLLLLRDFKRLGGWEEAPEGGIKMVGVGAGKASADGRDAGGTGSTIQFIRLS